MLDVEFLESCGGFMELHKLTTTSSNGLLIVVWQVASKKQMLKLYEELEN